MWSSSWGGIPVGYLVAKCTGDNSIQYPWEYVAANQFNVCVQQGSVQFMEWCAGQVAVKYDDEERKKYKGLGKKGIEITEKYYWNLDLDFQQDYISIANNSGGLTCNVGLIMTLLGIRVFYVHFIGNMEVAKKLACEYYPKIGVKPSKDMLVMNNRVLRLTAYARYTDVLIELFEKYNVTSSFTALKFQMNYGDKLMSHISTDKKLISGLVERLEATNKKVLAKYSGQTA